ncbi:PIG-L family deacetylase [Nonomuraea sp. NPDC059007]|uniref:PIG-L family deacetylase n=1 Tax=Nonomuraea sp. NPDC059007 TaxID=3346692 RepID=UPI00369A1191
MRLFLASLLMTVMGAVLPAEATMSRLIEHVHFMHFLAHEDDDLLFLNPDIHQTIRAGYPIASVFLTAGEAQEGYAYAEGRREGSRAAYARMAGVDAPIWDTEALRVGTQVVEHNHLRGTGVHLLFLRLSDGGNKRRQDARGRGALVRLWDDQGKAGCLPTFTERGSPYEQCYTYGGLVGTLRRLMEMFTPHAIRTQDPQPDLYRTHDHPDHVQTARFTAEAARQHRDANPRLVEINFRDYFIQDVPANLGPAERDTKKEIFDAYAPHDPLARDSDLNYPAYVWRMNRMVYRWTGELLRVAANADKRLSVLSVQGRRVVSWDQGADGRWRGPKSLGYAGSWLAPGVAVERDRDGRLRAFAIRLRENGLTDAIITTAQRRPGGPWTGQWTDLGRPPYGGNRTGTPALALDQLGRINVFVQTGTHQISYRTHYGNGRWSPWWTLSERGLRSGITAMRDRFGRIELFATLCARADPARTRCDSARILRWRQTKPNGGFRAAPIGSTTPGSPPTLVLNADARLELLYRQGDLDTGTVTVGDVVRTRQEPPSYGWSAASTLPAPGGVGNVQAARGPNASIPASRVVLAVRNPAMGVSVAVQQEANGAYGPWQDLGGKIIGVPAVSADRSGRVMVFSLGVKGQLFACWQEEVGGARFTPWRILGW